jgi:hypothetical protein
VDRGVRHRLPALIGGNPFREEAAAFRLVFVTLGFFGLIALGSWISTWVGLGVAVALVLAAVALLWCWRRRVRASRLGAASRHVLLVSGGREIEPSLLASLEAEADVSVVERASDVDAALEAFPADELVAFDPAVVDELRARFLLAVRLVECEDYLPETPTR